MVDGREGHPRQACWACSRAGRPRYPADILGAKDRSFWLDGDLGGGISWQRFIAPLVAHGPVNTCVPGSILQQVPGTYTILGNVADDVKISMR